MNKLLIVAGIIAAASAGLQAAGPVDVGETPVRASFEDGPTGFRYVWQRDAGWQFAGRTPSAASAGYADQSPDSEPLAQFKEEVTGSRFVWRRDAGWTYAGDAATRTQRF